MAETKHSPLGPSLAKRWWNCPGSIALCATQPPSKSGEAAVEGTVAHALCEELVIGRTTIAGLMARVGQIVKEEGFDIPITDEMVNAAIMYRDVIAADYKALAAQGKPSPLVLPEGLVRVRG